MMAPNPTESLLDDVIHADALDGVRYAVRLVDRYGDTTDPNGLALLAEVVDQKVALAANTGRWSHAEIGEIAEMTETEVAEAIARHDQRRRDDR